MAELTENELRFLWTQRVDESEVMDCADMRPHSYKWAMEEIGVTGRLHEMEERCS
jgi:hypothetical protein